jgi:hypothetical protein
MVKLLTMSALLIASVVLNGCKGLTETSATDLTQKYIDGSWNAEKLKLGLLKVDRCSQLMLATDTSATANCTVHVELTEAGKEALRTRTTTFENTWIFIPSGSTMRASFGKQPDGGWLATGVQQ